MKKFQFLCLFMLSLSSVHSLSENNNSAPKKLTNIDIIGLGYDIVFGNPHTNVFDPGFKRAVIKLTYSENQLSADGKWIVPDSIQALQVLSCDCQSTTTEIHGLTSYSDSLSVDASISGKVSFVKFSASAGYQEMQKRTTSYRNTYVSSVATCIRYKLQTRGQAKIKASDEFVADIRNLPEFPDDARYFDFISLYGTHYADTVLMGAKMVIQHEFGQKAWAEMQKNGFNVIAGAKASFLKYSGKFDTTTVKEKEEKQEFESMRSNYNELYLGTLPPINTSCETWAANTDQSPYPMQYTLRSLDKLINTDNIDGIDSSTLSIKRELLSDALSRYCSSIKGCRAPALDLPPVFINNVTSSVIRSGFVTCLAPNTLMSCGLSNSDDPQGDLSRYAIPISNTACKCYDANGVNCQAWCSNSVIGFEIVSVFGNGSEFNASCSLGKKVIGCHLRPYDKTGANTFYYPYFDGSSCICNATGPGADCVATCASNIYDYNVVSAFYKGRSAVTATCPQLQDNNPNFVLGCGIKSNGNGRSPYRKASVSSEDSCECYDTYEPTCYAICGKFGGNEVNDDNETVVTPTNFTIAPKHEPSNSKIESSNSGGYSAGVEMPIILLIIMVMIIELPSHRTLMLKEGF